LEVVRLNVRGSKIGVTVVGGVVAVQVVSVVLI